MAYCDVMAVNDNFDKVSPKSGTIGVPPRLVTGRGTQGPKIGTSRQKRDRWQPYIIRLHALFAYFTYFKMFVKYARILTVTDRTEVHNPEKDTVNCQ